MDSKFDMKLLRYAIDLAVVEVREGGHGPKPKVSFHAFDTYEEASRTAKAWADANPHMKVLVWRL